MYAVGHFALGYLTGKVVSKALNVSLSIPLLFLVSVFPDVDILIPFLDHRGPMHSIFVHFLFFIPLFFVYKKQAVPYFLALIQHSLVGDYLTGGTQLFWPALGAIYGLEFGIESVLNLGLEWLLFVASVIVMFKSNDLKLLLQKNKANQVLFIPLMAVLLPAVVTFPMYIPVVLVVPHVFYLCLFVLSFYFTLKR